MPNDPKYMKVRGYEYIIHKDSSGGWRAGRNEGIISTWGKTLGVFRTIDQAEQAVFNDANSRSGK